MFIHKYTMLALLGMLRLSAGCLFPWLCNAVNDVGNAIEDTANDVGNAIEDTANDVADFVEDTANDVGQAVGIIPTRSPTRAPTRAPTPQPTPSPTRSPTPQPTPSPTPQPTTQSPTVDLGCQLVIDCANVHSSAGTATGNLEIQVVYKDGTPQKLLDFDSTCQESTRIAIEDKEIDMIIMENVSGDDAFWFDQVYTEKCREDWTWGTKDKMGYCLSSDRTNSFGQNIQLPSPDTGNTCSPVLVMDSEGNIYETVNKPPLDNKSCETATAKLETELQSEFKAVEATASSIGIKQYYEYGDSGDFRRKCASMAGVDHELNVEITCTASNSPTENIHLVVLKRPVCYAEKCSNADGERLLRRFTLTPTELLADEEHADKGDWTCAEVEGTSEDLNLCVEQTVDTADQSDVKAVTNDLEYKLEDQKFLFVFTKKSKRAIFDEETIDDYTDICEEEEGREVVKRENFHVDCRDEKGSITREYDVTRFPACLSTACTSKEEDDAIAKLLDITLGKNEGETKKSGDTCTISAGATLSTLAGLIVGVMVLVIEYY